MDMIVNENRILEILKYSSRPSRQMIKRVLEKAKEKKGLSLEEVGLLVNVSDIDLEGLFSAAYGVKNEIYGERLVFFAPLYVSDYCVNDCAYCNFHLCNRELKRKKLTIEEVGEQTEFLINMGHKRLLLEFGEDSIHNDIDYVISVIEKIYSVRTPKGNIRRLNVNIAATTVRNYRRLKAAHIGTYQLFQETYHRKTYASLHHGPKADYERQITAHERAFSAGLDDFGLGVLFGLYDWRFEVLGLVSHAQYMDKKYGVGPHTISVPRFQPAQTVTFKPQYSVSERDFLKLIAILRLAVPYTGMIISTREKPKTRRQAFKIGISQASAASRTTTGGYGKAEGSQQFHLQDERSLEEVIRDIVSQGFLPSFCTACYRRGRTGEKFMQLSKPGEIHHFCRSNGLLTFAEYLQDFTTDGLHVKGEQLIRSYLKKIDDLHLRRETSERLEKIRQGERDLYF